MRSHITRALVMFLGAFTLAAVPMHGKTHQCSNASVAGDWGYSYTGTIFTPGGALPGASVGRYSQDEAGNVTGSQSRCVARTQAWKASRER